MAGHTNLLLWEQLQKVLVLLHQRRRQAARFLSLPAVLLSTAGQQKRLLCGDAHSSTILESLLTRQETNAANSLYIALFYRIVAAAFLFSSSAFVVALTQLPGITDCPKCQECRSNPEHKIDPIAHPDTFMNAEHNQTKGCTEQAQN